MDWGPISLSILQNLAASQTLDSIDNSTNNKKIGSNSNNSNKRSGSGSDSGTNDSNNDNSGNFFLKKRHKNKEE